MGAASAIEAVSCVLSIQKDIVPPTINHDTLDPECDVDVVSGDVLRLPCNVVLNNALAFGGYDAVVCLAKPGVLPDGVGLAA